MKMFAKIVLGLLGVLALSGCIPLTDPTPTYRYRLTVEIDTPEGLKTGSSVIEVDTRVAGKRSIPSPGRRSQKVRGEAVAIEMPDGKVLFALLRSDDFVDWAGTVLYMLGPKFRGEDAVAQTVKAIVSDRREKTLPRYFPRAGRNPRMSGYPMLVTFEDLSDPTTVTRVDPDDLAATFGEGVSISRITVQVTDDPVTTGIEERLGWLPNYYDKMLDGNRIRTIEAENRFANNLSQGDFSKGTFQ
ncbi:hypothetical protein ACRAQ7_13955 [Erythrobacter sp. W53]|uniref:hypothetical protein n=1 Tax=Erythrobacter sp. W53 TaxID=3425947 RepID=UPI003D769BB3